LRIPILVVYALLLPAAVVLALRIPSEGSIDRLIIPSDPDFIATQDFHKVFSEGQTVVLLLEADDPWQPAVLTEASALEKRLSAIPGVNVFSAMSVYARAHPDFAITPEGAQALRSFATGADLFQKQGLVGAHFLGLATAFTTQGPDARDRVLEGIDAAIAKVSPAAVKQVRKVGAPYVVSWIEHETNSASLHYFPIFALFVIGIALFLYRSVRALVAILLSLATAVAFTVGVGWLLGYSFTVVSAVVPLTVMVTVLATLVYLHSRFVDQPEDQPLEVHHVKALSNKFLPVTASTVAAVLGFAALAVSTIRPIREMGIWTALGLALSWVVAFTLFPALQRALRTPTGRVVAVRSGLYDRVAAALPYFTWRFRWPLLLCTLTLAAAGVVALFGFPGRIAPMTVAIDQLDYLDADLPIRKDMVFFRDNVAGLNVVRVWVKTPAGAVTDPEVLRGLDRFTTEVQKIAGVSSALGPTTFLRMRRYLAGEGATLPDDPEAFAKLAADVEQLLLTEPELRGFLDVNSMANAQVTVVFERGEEAGYRALSIALQAAWVKAIASDPALKGVTMQVVGESMLQAKVATSLVPTLTESFAITAGLIFLAFLFVFRSPSARLMAMIPSFFAILVTFLGMRLLGGALNVATILIATTVLGTTENDQIHFFHHLGEADPKAGLDGGLRHTLRVSGRAIVFATLINAAGFMGLAFSNFPPLRQFGVVTSAAFVLAMIADFTALPGALWIVRRERPPLPPGKPS
jgi:predicted RND superfamily exporter protein